MFPRGFQYTLRKKIVCFASALKAFETQLTLLVILSGESKLLVFQIWFIAVTYSMHPSAH